MEELCLCEETFSAEDYANKVKEEHLLEAIEHFEEEEAEIEDLLAQDYHRQLHTEETLAEYIKAIRRVRDILYYLRRRFFDGPEEDQMNDITAALEQTGLKN